MPRAKHQTTLIRQWALLKAIPSLPPGKTTTELHNDLRAEGFEVTKRTVERDLEQLEPILPLRCNDISKPYGWHWLKGRRVEFGGTSQMEAIGLTLTRNVLDGVLPELLWQGLSSRFEEAENLLSELSDNPNTRWSDFLYYEQPGMSFKKPDLNQDVFEEIQNALLKTTRLRIFYRSAGADTAKKLTVTPLGILIQGVRPYLVACFSEEHPPFTYGLQRIEKAEALDEAATRPDKFSLKKFSEAGGGQFAAERKTITLKATIASDLANILEETPLFPDQKITKRKETYHLTAEVQDSWQLEFWILSQGPRITVKSPQSLRTRIVQALKATLEQYES